MSIERLIACAATGSRLADGDQPPAALTRRHGLGPLAHALGASGFERDAIASSLMHEHQERSAREVVSAIGRRGIPVMLIKGMASARRHYAEPGQRPMTDVDLLVPTDAHADAAEAIAGCGFWPAGDARERGRFHHALTLKRPGAAIDLHRSIVQPMRRGSRTADMWLRAEIGPDEIGAALVPDAVDEALITLTHIARHELAVRALSYVDAARMLAKIDRAELRQRALRASLWRGAKVAIALTDALSGGKCPAHLLSIHTDVLARRDPRRGAQLFRKLLLLDSPLEALRLALGAALERLGD